MVWGSRGSRGSGAPGHWGSHDPLKIITGTKSKVKFIFQNSASFDPRTGLSPSTSPSSSYSSSTSALLANKVSSVCLSWSPVDPPSTPTCSPPPPPSLSHSFANPCLLLLLLTIHKCTCTPFLLNVVPSKYFLRVDIKLCH